MALAAPARAGPRWPTWPTEVEQVAAPLHVQAEGPAESDRVRALGELERFATPVIIKEVVRALDDTSPGVRREALRICWSRTILACIPAASRIWGKGVDPTLRVSALRVLALDPDPSRLAILLGALRDPSDELRAETAEILGWAPLSDEGAKEARTALLAKLSDSSANVRRRAVESLGLLGPGAGTLAMARLLEDPDPTVRSAAATALARARDPKSAPALLRALESPNEAVVAQSILEALALVQGEDVPPALLHALDDPPEGLSAYKVAEAIGIRPSPEPPLIGGLIARLREPELRRSSLRALLLIGEPARGQLEAALERGLDAALQLEVQRLLHALDPPRHPIDTTQTWPDLRDVQAWHRQLRVGRPSERADAALALGRRAPSWLAALAGGRIAQAERPADLEPWLLAIATADRPSLPWDWLVWARLIGWAHERALPRSERCLALAVLATDTEPKVRAQIDEELETLLGDPDPTIRACLMLSRARSPEQTRWASLGLVDASPRVRTATALAMADAEELDAALAGRIAVMATVDPDARVRAAARYAATRRPLDAKTPPVTFVRADPPPFPWAKPMQWIEVRAGGRPLWIPAVGNEAMRWALVPGLRLDEPGTTPVAG